MEARLHVGLKMYGVGEKRRDQGRYGHVTQNQTRLRQTSQSYAHTGHTTDHTLSKNRFVFYDFVCFKRDENLKRFTQRYTHRHEPFVEVL